jgi:hypothetical protein
VRCLAIDRDNILGFFRQSAMTPRQRILVRSHQLCPAQQLVGQRLVVNAFTIATEVFYYARDTFFRLKPFRCPYDNSER